MPPELFLDRNLGRRVADGLRDRGWIGHHIGDAFPEDGQRIADEEWIDHGLRRAWVPLSKDGRIKTRDAEIQPVLDHKAVSFYLDSQQLPSIQMVERLDTHRTAIHQAIAKGGRPPTPCGTTASNVPGRRPHDRPPSAGSVLRRPRRHPARQRRQ